MFMLLFSEIRHVFFTRKALEIVGMVKLRA